MSDPTEAEADRALEAARGLLATLEAGRGALLALASAHLPFARALAIHRAYAEGGADLVAAEEAVTLRAELYWQSWRGAVRTVAEPAPSRPSAAAAPRKPRPEPARERPAKPPREVISVDPGPPPRAWQPEPPPPATPIEVIQVAPVAEVAVEVAPVAEVAAEVAPVPDAPPAPWAGQVGTRSRPEPSPIRLIDPVTESPLMDEILRGPLTVEAPADPKPVARMVDFDQLPFEPISELDYVDDDGSEVTQVAQVSVNLLHPVGAPAPGEGAGAPVPERPRPELIVDDFNEISELEELEPGEYGLREPKEDDDDFAASGASGEPAGLPIRAHRADDEEVLAQGDAPILPEFNSGNSDDLSLSFEVGAGLLKAAPRLTDEEEVSPQAAAPRKDVAADQRLFQKALSEAENAVGRGDLARAIQYYSDALDISPGSAEAHIGRGRTHLELGDYSSAMSDFQRAEDQSPNDPESHLAMGDLYYNRKEYKRAIDFYDEAVELDGQHAMAKCKRGLAHYYRKNYRQAFQDLQRAMALDPAIPNIHKYVQMAQKKMDGKG